MKAINWHNKYRIILAWNLKSLKKDFLQKFLLVLSTIPIMTRLIRMEKFMAMIRMNPYAKFMSNFDATEMIEFYLWNLFRQSNVHIISYNAYFCSLLNTIQTWASYYQFISIIYYMVGDCIKCYIIAVEWSVFHFST